MTTFLVILLFIVFLIFVWVFFLQISYSVRSSRMVFFPTFLTPRVKSIFDETIKQNIDKTGEYNFVELGAGVGSISRFLTKNYNWNKVIGVEVDLPTILMARVFNFFSKHKIEIVQKDILRYPIPTPALCYCYLNPSLMKAMHRQDKFKNCIVISTSFAIEGVAPAKVYTHGRAEPKIYIYDFREKQI